MERTQWLERLNKKKKSVGIWRPGNCYDVWRLLFIRATREELRILLNILLTGAIIYPGKIWKKLSEYLYNFPTSMVKLCKTITLCHSSSKAPLVVLCEHSSTRIFFFNYCVAILNIPGVWYLFKKTWTSSDKIHNLAVLILLSYGDSVELL